ncbi:MAG: TIGR03560 family F420-dependent LLM class oxidoreductase [Candidatus Binatia bacterium]
MTVSRRRFLQGATAILAGASGWSGNAYGRSDETPASVRSAASKKKTTTVSVQEQRMTRFGIQIEPQFGFTFPEIADLAKEAERLGYTAMWASDHLLWDAKSERRNCLDVWALMPALATVTTTLRLGTLVTCNSYRIPSVLAKTAASVDHMSNGRLEFGLGAGWKEIEYKAYGIPFPPVATRLAQLEEAAQLIKLLWTEERASFTGKHYQLNDATCAPKPVQQPLKMWIGGAGEKKLLRMVAQYADGWNMIFGYQLPAVKKKLEVLQRHCDAVGRDFSKIEKSLFIVTCIADSEEELKRRDAEAAAALGTKRIFNIARDSGTIGTAEHIVDTLRSYQDLGFDYFIAMFPYKQDKEMLQRFAETVMPHLK